MQCLLCYDCSLYYKRSDSRPRTLAKSWSAVSTPVTPVTGWLYETMITISAKDYNHFSQDAYDSLIAFLQIHRVRCSCGHAGCLKIHSYYVRGVLLPDGSLPLWILRVICSVCGHTHAILPASLVPYDRIPLADQHRIILAYDDGSDPFAVCEDNLQIDENNVKSVIRRYVRFWLQRLLSEELSLTSLAELIRGCFAHYSMQFMQIRRTTNRLFADTT